MRSEDPPFDQSDPERVASRGESGAESPTPTESANNAQSSRDRWAFLAEASRCLADSLEYETTLETVAGLALPLLGSWSIVDLVEGDGSVRRLSIVHPDPQQQLSALELKAGWPPRREDPMGVAVVAQTGTSELVAQVPDELLVSVARNEENLRRLRALGMKSLMTVPIRARGRILGAITFISSSESRRFTDADLSLAEDLGERCGLAIDNARMHRAAQRLFASERARLQAEVSSQIKTEFLATVGHELRTPLNVMAGYLELLAMEIAGPLTALQREYVERVQTGEEQLLRIVEDMLNFVRLSADDIEYDLSDVALRPIVQNVAAAYRQGLEEKGLQFETKCDPGVRAHTDPAKVWQILMNLLSNARKFTDAGGKVTLECAMEADGPIVRVIDNGCGIPLDKLESVFEPFVQADESLSRTAEGMGLGLSISRHLARDMGGSLAVTSSEVGTGCTFVLRLAPVKET
ncbi:MAG: GAF domain-containing sensor histidine kinase [Gemmatimonadota bacterium]